MAQIGLYIKFREKLTRSPRGVSVGRTIIPLHLTEDVDEMERSIILCAGWKLWVSGEFYVISYHKLSIMINTNLVEFIRTI